MEKCLIFLSSITSEFRSFFHWIVFNLFFLLRDSENDLLAPSVYQAFESYFKHSLLGLEINIPDASVSKRVLAQTFHSENESDSHSKKTSK